MSIIWKTVTVLSGLNCVSICFRIFLATLIGAAIGSERGRHGRAAGARTYTLVCLGACVTIMVGLYSVIKLNLGGDPMRIGAQVISGIGFLGAGTILTRNNSQIIGLTTAAGLWTTAAIGLAIGCGFYLGALLCFAATEITIRLFDRHKYVKHTYSFYLELDSIDYVHTFCDQFDTADVLFQLMQAKSGVQSHIGMELAVVSPDPVRVVLDQLRAMEHVIIALPQND